MSVVRFKLLDMGDDEKFLTVYVPGKETLVASPESHNNFDELVRLAQAGDEAVYDKFDVGRVIAKKFTDVVEGRVAVRGGTVYFDDDPVDNAITEAILRFHEAGDDFAPLVKFMENVYANPQEESREQFYRFVDKHGLTINSDGEVVLYKAVVKDTDGKYKSNHAGEAYVNGEYVKGRIPNAVGDVITMGRSDVAFDPNTACHAGLHAGTYDYARWFLNNGTVMHVLVNPRDVVSVPHDASSQKVRVCRYKVIGFANEKYDGNVFPDAKDETKVTDVSKATRVDTRENHKRQVRDKFGRFLPKR